MQINKHKKISTKVIIFSLLLVLLIGGAVFAFIYTSNQFQVSKQANASDDKDKMNALPPEQDGDSNLNDNIKGGNVAPEPTEEASPQASLKITRLEQADGKITVSATAANISQGGRCIVYLSSNAPVISEYMNVSPIANGVNCDVSIDEMKFTYLGEWTARITYTTTDNKIIETKQKLTIK